MGPFLDEVQVYYNSLGGTRHGILRLCPFPVSRELVEEYLQEMREKGKPASFIRGFVEALNFCKHVVGIDVSCDTEDLISAKIHRMIEASDAMRKEKNQARVLTVKEVEHLELYLADERCTLTDRFASGCMLFCLYRQEQVVRHPKNL